MKIFISPTKEMRSNVLPLEMEQAAKACFSEKALELNRLLKAKPLDQLLRLMKISPKLGEKVKGYIDNFEDITAIKNPAIFAYSGLAFKSLEAINLNAESLNFAQKHLRILSAYYGVLKPLDLISPYRLEMTTPIDSLNLYDFWTPMIHSFLDKDILNQEVLINLASLEYGRMIENWNQGKPLVHIHFKEETTKGLVSKGTYAKMARGQMVKLLLTERISNSEDIKELKPGGYSFNHPLSSSKDWIFIR